MNSKERESIQRKIVAGIRASMDRLIRERMKMQRPMVVMRDGKVLKVSPFELAKERWPD